MYSTGILKYIIRRNIYNTDLNKKLIFLYANNNNEIPKNLNITSTLYVVCFIQ